MSKRRPPHLERYPWFDRVRAKGPARGLKLIANTLSIFPFLLGSIGLAYLPALIFSERLGGVYGPIVLGFGGLVCAMAVYWTIEQMLQPDGLALLKQDLRPPIVFLRSFSEDGGPPNDQRVLGASRQERERALVEGLSQLGPVVAIGQPGDHSPVIGIARLYVTDEHWQEVVISLLSQSAAIILQPDDSPGTKWEIDAVGAHADLRRVLLIVPNFVHRPLGYERVRRAAATSLPPLPEQPGDCDAFVFSDDGAPRALGATHGDASRVVSAFLGHIRGAARS